PRAQVSEYTAWSSQFYAAIVQEALAACGHSRNLVQIVTGFADAGTAEPTPAARLVARTNAKAGTLHFAAVPVHRRRAGSLRRRQGHIHRLARRGQEGDGGRVGQPHARRAGARRQGPDGALRRRRLFAVVQRGHAWLLPELR